jgi:hypothetical protein
VTSPGCSPMRSRSANSTNSGSPRRPPGARTPATWSRSWSMVRPGGCGGGDLARVREQARQAEEAYQVARQAADRERAARYQQQQYQAHQEANPDLVDRRRELLGVQAWRKRADAHAAELLRPEWSRELGERPATVKGGRAWDRAMSRPSSTGSAGTWRMLSIRWGGSRTARMCRLSSGRRGGRRPARLVASATSPTTGPTGPSGATIGRRPVAAARKATARTRPDAATTGATAGDRSTANATTTTSAPWSRWSHESQPHLARERREPAAAARAPLVR